jgi:hypothetical protein
MYILTGRAFHINISRQYSMINSRKNSGSEEVNTEVMWEVRCSNLGRKELI